MTRKELAQELYKAKIRNGNPLIPIGSTKRMSEQEFVRRYLNGVGVSRGFKKDTLEYLLSKELLKEKENKKKQTRCS